jgi:hypothetical protein
MKLLAIQQRINDLMSQFVTEVKGSNAVGRTDINKAAETFLIPLLSEVYGWRNLKNLNIEEGENYPAIDLGDKEAGIAIQVTSTPNSEKIKDSLQKFVGLKLFEQYPMIRFYILSEKQSSYTSKGFADIIQGRFAFNPNDDILDYRDILRTVMGFPVDKAGKVLSVLETNISQPVIVSGPTISQNVQIPERVETVTLNLFEIYFPDTLYIAELLPDIAKKVSENNQPRPRVRGRMQWKSKRDLVREALGKYAVDWEVYENKIITFQDLQDEDLPLSKIIDVATAEPFSPDEFYDENVGQENSFKSLLRKCLQQLLYHRQVSWQNDRHLFIFVDKNGEDLRKEKWKGKVSAERIVFERTRKPKEPDKTWYCKHLAFETQFRQFNGKWFLSVRPDWFFSYDSYHESFYAADKLSWLKRQENNDQVLHQLLFLHYFLTHEPQPELFENRVVNKYPFLSFGELTTFDNALHLPDGEWNPPDKSITDNAGDQQMVLDL